MLELTFTFSYIVPLPEDKKKTKKQKTKNKKKNTYAKMREETDDIKTLVGWGRGVTSQFSE